MHTPIYFDNAATTFPKPQTVYDAAALAMRNAGGNPGRGGHPLARRAGEIVYHARETAAAMFGTEPENVVFTGNCTHALNLAIHGTLRQGDHVIISALEHNSVARPVAALAERGIITYSAAPVFPDSAETLDAFASLIRPQTRAVICTLVSNVTGQILPFREIAALCRSHGLRFIADGAQACGVIPVTLADGMDLLCTAGHKGLFGLMGTGMLLSRGTVPLTPLMQGGTGSLSNSLRQPDFLPDALEAGTVNVPGIASLDAGMQFVQRFGISHIFAHESALCEQVISGLRKIPGITVFRHADADYAPVVSFVHERIPAPEIGEQLAARGFCVRAGIHCSPLAHSSLGTETYGTVRFAPSVMNRPQEAEHFVRAVRQIVQ
ncbi:MAG: aminotransferase class V-fold PLP-dependent enzyme [Oscillospiraceae bacterium]|nr:aminotransferase class V-fold PLP-dependent enzyme [Oscillospiraceae bacterium]